MTELEKRGRLIRVSRPVSLVHEITEIHRRVLAEVGPALLFERPVRADGAVSEIPLLANLFGTPERIELGYGIPGGKIGDLADLLAELREPRPPASLRDALKKLPVLRSAMALGCRRMSHAECQDIVFEGEGVDLNRLPIQWCWPGEPAPLITWGLVVTASPSDPKDVNVGVYRLQALDRRRLISAELRPELCRYPRAGLPIVVLRNTSGSGRPWGGICPLRS